MSELRKLAIIAAPERVNDYVGLAIRAGFEIVNSISGHVFQEDIDQSDCVIFIPGWRNDSYLLQLVNRSIELKKPVISITQLNTSQKMVHFNNDTLLITYLTHCPYCLSQYSNHGTIDVSEDLTQVTFKNFYCMKCNKKSQPIHHIKHSMYAMDC